MDRALTVGEAVASRRSVRAFLDRPVDAGTVRGILEAAGRAPSGGNLQPWVIHTVCGERLETLKSLMRRRIEEAPDGEPMDLDFYPASLAPAYADRRWRCGSVLYAALGIDREDTARRRAWINENFQFFGAPFGVFCFMERGFGPYQWLDLGIYLQTVMLLLREAGLDSCPQADWAMFAPTVCRFLGAPENLRLVCGMAVGYRDPAVPIVNAITERDSVFSLFPDPAAADAAPGEEDEGTAP